MNALQKRRMKIVLKYTWPFYLIAAVLVTIILNIIFATAHQPPAYKTLTLFVSGEIKDAKKLRKDMLAKFEDKEIKDFSCISARPNDTNYHAKLTIPGYADADILIIPTNILDNIIVSDFALDLSDEMIGDLYQDYTFYPKDGVNYGIKLNKDIVKEYMTLPEEECYMLFNGHSENTGKYSPKQVAEHDMALTLAKEWGM